MHIGVYRSQQQGYGHPLQLFMSRKVEERNKTKWGKYSLKKGHRTNFEMFLQQFFHLEAVHSAHSSEDKDMLKTYYFKFCALSLLEGEFSPCGFASFLTFLDIIIVKG